MSCLFHGVRRGKGWELGWDGWGGGCVDGLVQNGGVCGVFKVFVLTM